MVVWCLDAALCSPLLSIPVLPSAQQTAAHAPSLPGTTLHSGCTLVTPVPWGCRTTVPPSGLGRKELQVGCGSIRCLTGPTLFPHPYMRLPPLKVPYEPSMWKSAFRQHCSQTIRKLFSSRQSRAGFLVSFCS